MLPWGLIAQRSYLSDVKCSLLCKGWIFSTKNEFQNTMASKIYLKFSEEDDNTGTQGRNAFFSLFTNLRATVIIISWVHKKSERVPEMKHTVCSLI